MRKTLWAALLIAAAGVISFRSTYEPDLWWHLAQGREAAAGRLLHTNLFSAAYAEYPQHYTSWLFDLCVYVLFTRLGAAGVQAAQALLIAGALALVARTVRMAGSPTACLAVCALGWAIVDTRALPRPHVVSFLAMAASAWLVERARVSGSWRPLRWTPVIIAAWSNVHIECVFGVALVGLFGVCESLRPRDLVPNDALKAIGIAAVSLLATAANPYGFGLLRHTWLNSSVPQFITIAELQPPYLPDYLAFYAWAGACAMSLAVNRRNLRIFDVVVVLFFAGIGLRYLRLTPLLVFASASILARGLDAASVHASLRRLCAVSMAALALVSVRAFDGRGLAFGGAALEPRDLFSPAAMQFARERRLAGPAFTSINLGGYVAWHLYPEARVFVDSRLQAYPPEHFRAIRDASFDFAAWDRLTAGVDWAVLSVPRVNPLTGAGRFDSAEWASAYRDEAIEILVRRRGRYGALAAVH